jgi:GNAT superfamily N-acetyltransferase
VAQDAAQIAGVDVRAWWHAYRPFLDEQRLAERDVEQRTAVWAGNLAEGALGETWVLEVAGRIAGFVSAGRARDDDDAPGAAARGEIYALYVDPPAQGAGAGTTLLAHAEERLRALGHERAMLWTFTDNGLARRFYERHGWVLEDAGARNESCEAWAPAVRYGRVLGAPRTLGG